MTLYAIKNRLNNPFCFFCPLHLCVYSCLLSAVADLQRMFPTPPSLEQHPAFSPIMTYRDTPSQEPPAPSGAADHLLPLASTHLTEYRMETDESMVSPRQEDLKVSGGCKRNKTNRFA